MEEQHKSVHTGGMCYSQGPLSGRGKTFKVVQWYCVVEQYRMVVLGYWKKKKQKQSKAKARIPFLKLKEKLQRVQSRAETGSHR